MGQDIDAALEGKLNALVIGRMRENGFSGAMGLGNDGGRQVQRHDEDASGLNGASKDFDAIGAIVDLLADAHDGLRRGVDFWKGNMVFCEESPNVNRGPSLCIKGLADGENARTGDFAGSDAAADGIVLSSTEAISKTVVKPQRVSICSSCEESLPAERFSAWSRPWVKMWTWLFQKPAVTTRPLQSMMVTARAKRGGLVVPPGPTAVMRPSWMRIIPFSMGESVGEE